MPLPQWSNTSSGGAGSSGGGPGTQDFYFYFQAFPHTCSILRATETEDGYGGMTRVWAAVATEIKCSLDSISGSMETVDGGAVRAITTYKVYMPLETDVTASDRLSINPVDNEYGYTPAQEFEVIDTDVGRAHQNAMTVICRRISDG